MSWSYDLDAYMLFVSFFEAHVRPFAEVGPQGFFDHSLVA